MIRKLFRIATILSIIVLVLSACTTNLTGGTQGSFLFNRPSNLMEQKEPGPIIQAEEIIILLLVIAAIVSLASQWLRIPYTVGLVLVGFSLTLIGNVPVYTVMPEIILALLVPPLVFEAAFYINFSDLRKDLPLIIVLTVPGVILTTLLVGGLVSFTAGITLEYALVFGALIAATDPVAVVALFRRMGAPKRLQVLLEGESLLNDGTAIVLFNMMLAIALTGRSNLGLSIVDFIVVAGGGILVGIVTGIIVTYVIGRIDNALVETTLTIVLAYGSYLIAEYLLGVSGVLAVVAAGLASGQIGPRGMSPTTRIVVFNFWETVAFLANSFIFLIIGLQIDANLLWKNLPAIGWAILAVLIARVVTIYGLSWIGKNIPIRWKNIMFWGGLRGAISLALALSLSANIPNREQLQAMAFGVVLFTLVVEGLTMSQLVRRSGLVRSSEVHGEYERIHARAIGMRSAQASVKKLNADGLISDYTWRTLKPVFEKRTAQLTENIHTKLEENPNLHQEELADAWREALRALRSTYISLFRDNIISEDAYADLVSEVDFLLTDPNSTWPEEIGKPEPEETE